MKKRATCRRNAPTPPSRERGAGAVDAVPHRGASVRISPLAGWRTMCGAPIVGPARELPAHRVRTSVREPEMNRSCAGRRRENVKRGRGLGGRGASRNAAEVIGGDRSGGGGRLDRFGKLRQPDPERSGGLDCPLVSKLAHRAVLVGVMLVVTDGLGHRRADQHERQDGGQDGPGEAASCARRANEIVTQHRSDKVAETAPSGKAGRGPRPARHRRSTPAGQWSEPVTCGQMNASVTRRAAAGDAST